MKQREIRFRAWDKEEKKMYWYSSWSTLDNKRTLVFENEHEYVDNSDYREDVELMEFTGLKDKNGKEIYEGDILKVVNGMKGEIGVVQWATLEWRINWDWSKNLGKYDYRLTCKDDLEIIGNIYENKELLK